jgi:hypothetical protein
MFHHVRSTDKLHLRPPECDGLFYVEVLMLIMLKNLLV